MGVYASWDNWRSCHIFYCVKQTAVRLDPADSLINAHVYAPDCSNCSSVPALCDSNGRNSCGRISYGRLSRLLMFDGPFAYECFDYTDRYAR